MLSALKKQVKISNSLTSFTLRTASVSDTKLSMLKKFNADNARVPFLFKNSSTDDYVSQALQLIFSVAETHRQQSLGYCRYP